MDFEPDPRAGPHRADGELGTIAIAAQVTQHDALKLSPGFAQLAHRGCRRVV